MRAEMSEISDWAAVEARFWALAPHCDTRFFRGPAFLFCAAEKRFDRPYLVAVTQDNRDVALGLCNRRGRRFYLHASGVPDWDRIFVEHNGFLCRPGESAAIEAGLRAILRLGPVVLPGVDRMTLAAAARTGRCVITRTSPAPFADLAAITGDYIDLLSANTRAQLRRSLRELARVAGAAAHVVKAETEEQYKSFFDDLVLLHQARWQGKGKTGAFDDSEILAFHRALIARAAPGGEIELLQMTAGPRLLGYFYNFIAGARVMNYQAGFVPASSAAARTGLLCHLAAIRYYHARGIRIYDFLAGDQRYKKSLAPHGAEDLSWATLYPRYAIAGLVAALRNRVRG
jgi:CelD/BcsL family acetyltransferase involved in cellulose biosynthesis